MLKSIEEKGAVVVELAFLVHDAIKHFNFSYHFTIQPTFLQYFPNLFIIQLTLLP
jgi:hypothetical protein